ncbi:MAG: PBP1A family penicillin-binding protein [Alphaproteobacteria bacterium]|nr:PBP1A family penicillin-binding protein [Alphaproteobacteria bacterium]
MSSRNIKLLLSIVFLSIVLSIFLFLLSLILYFRDYRIDFKSLIDYRPFVASRLYAEDGTLLKEYAEKRRIFIPSSKIPQLVKDAFISTEDKNFYHHGGIDIAGISRSTIFNVLGLLGLSSKSVSGASTITQQVVRNIYLDRSRNIVRKTREILISLQMERILSKEEILEVYLNHIYLGNRSYGIGSASLIYFNKSLEELSPGEAAFLAGLPKAPTLYSNNTHKATIRRDYVLGRMLTEKKISKEEYSEAIDNSLVFSKTFVERQSNNFLYFTEEIRRKLVEGLDSDTFYNQGLYIRTSLNPTFQQTASSVFRTASINFDKKTGFRKDKTSINIFNDDGEIDENIWHTGLKEHNFNNPIDMPSNYRRAIVLEIDTAKATIGLLDKKVGTVSIGHKWKLIDSITHKVINPSPDLVDLISQGDVIWAIESDGENTFTLGQSPKIEGGMIVMSPHTGRILSMVGGFSFKRSSFNRAIQASRQGGSTIKPFLYLSALESGEYTPNTLILDAPLVLNKTEFEKWKPHNYNKKFNGQMTMQRSLEISQNIPAIRLLESIGIKRFYRLANRFEIYSTPPSLDLSLALGSGNTTLLNMTLAYAKLMTGKDVSPSLIDYIQNRDGKTIYRSMPIEYIDHKNGRPPQLSDDRKSIGDPAYLYQIMNMLEGVMIRGSGKQVNIPSYSIAGKTGTSDSAMDAWFMGMTPHLIVGIYFGYDKPQSLGDRVTGGNLSGKVFKSFMDKTIKMHPNTPFYVPDNINFIPIDLSTGNRPTDTSKNNDIILMPFKKYD